MHSRLTTNNYSTNKKTNYQKDLAVPQTRKSSLFFRVQDYLIEEKSKLLNGFKNAPLDTHPFVNKKMCFPSLSSFCWPQINDAI